MYFCPNAMSQVQVPPTVISLWGVMVCCIKYILDTADVGATPRELLHGKRRNRQKDGHPRQLEETYQAGEA